MTKSPVSRTARSPSRLAPWPLLRPSEYRFDLVVGGNAPQRVKYTAPPGSGYAQILFIEFSEIVR